MKTKNEFRFIMIFYVYDILKYIFNINNVSLRLKSKIKNYMYNVIVPFCVK